MFVVCCSLCVVCRLSVVVFDRLSKVVCCLLCIECGVLVVVCWLAFVVW